MRPLSEYSDEELMDLYQAAPAEPAKNRPLAQLSDDELMQLYQAHQDEDERGMGEKIANYLPDSAERGVLKALQQGAVVEAKAGRDPEAVAKNIARYQRGIQRAAMSPEDEAGMRSISESKGVGEALKNIVTNPSAVGSSLVEGLAANAPTLGAFTVGGAGGPLGAGVLGGAAAANQEYAASFLDYFQKNKVDLGDDKQIQKALSNPKLVAEASDYATKRGAIMGGAQALSGPIAGKFVAAAKPGIGGLAVAGAKELAAQGAIQGGGEAGAEYATTGELRPGDITAATTLGAIAQAPEIAIGARARVRPDIEAPIIERTPIEEAAVAEKPTLALPSPTPEELRRGNPDAIVVNPEGDAMLGRATDSGERYLTIDDGKPKPVPPKVYEISDPINDTAPTKVRVAGDEEKGYSIVDLDPKNPGNSIDITELKKAGFSDEQAIAETMGRHEDGAPADVSKVKRITAPKEMQSILPDVPIIPKKAEAPLPKKETPALSPEVQTASRNQRADRLEQTAKARESAGYPEEAALYREKANELRSGPKEEIIPTERFSKQQSEVGSKVVAALKRMNPGLKVETAAQMFGEGDALKRSGAMSDKTQPVAGGYDALNNIARISLDERYDPMDTAFHEGWHSLEPHFSEPDKKLLLDAFPAQGNVNHSERTAIAFADWAKKPTSVPAAVRPTFTRIKRFLKETGNLLRGKGFNSVDKIFEKAKSGQVAEEAGIVPLSESASPTDDLQQVRYSFGTDPVGSVAAATGLDAPKTRGFLEESRKLRKYMSDTDLGKTTEGKRIKELPSTLRALGYKMAEINSEWFGSIRGLLDVIHGRTGSETIAKIRDMISPEPGTGRYVAESYQDEAIRLSETAAYKTNKALEKFLNDPKAMKAIEFLVSNRDQINLKSGSAIDRTAQMIADTLDDFSKQLKAAGVDVGHVENYFPTSWDDSKIIGNSDQFIDRAAEAYKAQAKSEGLKITDDQAVASAEAWLQSIEGGGDGALIGNGTPAFTKSRVFGKEARTILDDFRIKDPISALNNYYHRAGNLVAYEKRFSAEKLKEYRNAMRKEGVSERDREKVMTAIASATGRYGSSMSSGARGKLAALQYLNSLITLPRAAVSSIMEPVTAGVRSGNLKDSFDAMYQTMRFLFSSSKDTQATKDYIGMVSGVINDMGTQMMMASRYELMGSSSNATQRKSNRFFEVTGLAKLTEAQRLASAVVYDNFIYRMAKAYKEGNGRKSAGELMVEHGVKPESLDAFADYVMKRKEAGAGLDDKQKDFNEMYALGMRRFVDGSIQHTKRGERPIHANHPIGRMFYALQGYMNGFTQNVLLRSVKMAKRGLMEKGYTAGDRLRLLAPSVMLGTVFAASQAALNEAKGVIYTNPDQGKQDNLQSIFQYLNSAGFSGNYGILINSAAAVGYGREPQSVLTGPLAGNIGKAVASTVKLGVNNSKNNNNAERGFAKDFYTTVVQPTLINTVVTSVPGSLLPFTLVQAVAHPATKAAFTEAVAGRKKKKD